MIIENVIKILEWCKIKILLSDRSPNILFKEGELWWCRIGMNVGHEIYGKGENFIRPVLIFKRFNENIFLGIPLTSKKKEGSWYVPVVYGRREGWVILNQMKAMDRSRLIKRIGTLGADTFGNVYDAFWDLYKIATPPLRGGAGGNPKDDSIIPGP